jgi:muramoyltetrapeptide carboxypeptidase
VASKKSQSASPLWPALQVGDTVDVIAPGFACTPEVLTQALHFLASWGLEGRVSRKIFSRDVLCSSDDTSRMRQLKEALLARDSKAVWCLRGGYGSIRLVPELVKIKRPPGPPKLFIGLSDLSTIHIFLNQVWGWPTVHGPLLDRFAKGEVKPAFAREMKSVIFGEVAKIEFKTLKPLNAAAKKPGKIRAEITGGNLITLQSSIGTKAEWETSGKILFFEDIGERGYRIDRVLEQFRQLGLFDRARAVVFGTFTGGLEADGTTKIPAVLKRFAQSVRIPVLSGIDSGHGPVQRPVPFGTESTLFLGDGPGRLSCVTGSHASDSAVQE